MGILTFSNYSQHKHKLVVSSGKRDKHFCSDSTDVATTNMVFVYWLVKNEWGKKKLKFSGDAGDWTQGQNNFV